MYNNSIGIVSVIGIKLIEPILALVEKLDAIPFVAPNEVQTPVKENGYSSAIVTLSALLLESAINRTKYIRQEISSKTDLVDYFSQLTSDGEVAADLDEVVAIRDLVVHNHLWEADVYWDNNYELKFTTPPKLLDGFGNSRQRRVMDVKTRLSRRLKLNLFPLKISRIDAYTSLRVVGQDLEILEAKDHRYFPISNHYFNFRGKSETLKQIITTL